METTAGTLLGGRVVHTQPRRGFRSGIEPVVLAASVPAGPGETILDAGTGAGAALLCLAARLPGIAGLGIEREPDLAAIADRNVGLNRWRQHLRIVAGDITRIPVRAGSIDHVMSNPPYHVDAGTPSPERLRAEAKQASAILLESWIEACATCLRRHGTLSLILPASQHVRAAGALARSGCGAITLIPLWRRPGVAAKLVVIRGSRGSRGPDAIEPGLVLHGPAGGFTPEAEAVLRDGAALYR